MEKMVLYIMIIDKLFALSSENCHFQCVSYKNRLDKPKLHFLALYISHLYLSIYFLSGADLYCLRASFFSNPLKEEEIIGIIVPIVLCMEVEE